ncbi:MAG: pyridoxamine 5'-phosphate oxidase family protein [Dehalococcoidia bacterium]
MPDEMTSSQAAEPRAGRPLMPGGYGIARTAEGMLPWSWASGQIAASRNYWVVSAQPNGRPHAAPVWGVWIDGTLYFSTSRASRKGRNLLANPQLIVHLESGDDAVILEGKTQEVTDAEILAQADAAYSVKYINKETGEGFLISWDAGDSNAVFALRPDTVLAWQERSFPNTATRWTF